MTHLPHWFKKTFVVLGKGAKLLAVYGGAFGMVSGIIFSTWQFGLKEYTKNESQKRADLSSYASYGIYLKDYNDTIKRNMAKFLSSKNIVSSKPSVKDGVFAISKSQEINELDGDYILESRENEFNQTCKAFLKRVAPTTQSGFESLKSKELEEYKTIHNFYDSLGFSIEADLINFETVFELFTYPAYWKDGDQWAEFDPFYELERCLKENYYGYQKRLYGYSGNFLKLGNNYHYKRLVDKYKLLKNENKQLNVQIQHKCKQKREDKECIGILYDNKEIRRKIEHNEQIIKSIRDEKQRIERYSENKNLPFWYQLYNDVCSKDWYYLPPKLGCIGKYEK